jgi:hypothetical protein
MQGTAATARQQKKRKQQSLLFVDGLLYPPRAHERPVRAWSWPGASRSAEQTNGSSFENVKILVTMTVTHQNYRPSEK